MECGVIDRLRRSEKSEECGVRSEEFRTAGGGSNEELGIVDLGEAEVIDYIR